MKTLILWLGAFGFPIINHLARIHPDQIIYGYEKDDTVRNFLIQERRHPYFFTEVWLEKNIEIVETLESILSEVEILIVVIPNQFIESTFWLIGSHLRENVTIINLSKGINNTTLETVSGTLSRVLTWKKYHYASLSGGMIASELMEKKPLWADIATQGEDIGEMLKKLFESETLEINITKQVKNTELAGALKNIIALYTGYLEWAWYGASSVGYYLIKIYRDMNTLAKMLGWEEDFRFDSFALGGDIIATSFGSSRNRYFGKLVGSGKTVAEARDVLKSEKKHAEWYETLKWVAHFIEWKIILPELEKVCKIFL